MLAVNPVERVPDQMVVIEVEPTGEGDLRIRPEIGDSV
jgi:hypothetical protein